MSAQPVPTPVGLPIVIRDMTSDDVAAIMAIEHRAYEFPWTDVNFLDSLRSGYIGRIAERQGGELVGYAMLMPAVDDLHVLNLCVAPLFQGRGIGQQLLRDARRVALSRDIYAVLLEVRPSNTHAIRLYERFGFHEIGRRRNYYPARNNTREDAIVMRVKVKREPVNDVAV
ncbi:ribosomal protein S18-alanine N-acetyltransferase [Robbsia sp. KACC 23696]|uniref:ribosomal protein S18-alanine N-acetyltransferase n=1 Tax=Robbsia sp. KACC 23696 TaxID=3149231 RepID=UPI00325A8129